ncbi:MAG: intradiol ring-cleavage dioxygenase [Verrucomicrobiales bacterium]|nr:intradiol ring-cleavage dioxygenase [Verrucomicrobiales bacterium]
MIPLTHRRRFLARMVFGSLVLGASRTQAARRLLTPMQTEGPFYPDHLPLDTDNDLLFINDSPGSALGEVTWLSGRILDTKGKPVRGATVEIWQCDRNGAYLHTQSGNRERRDTHFQGFGRFVTDSSGEYLFRTIKPVPYPGRTPHIHFAVKSKGRERFTTQCYVRGEPGNAGDAIWKSVTDARQRDSMTVPFQPAQRSGTGELAARFDIILGFTPEA